MISIDFMFNGKWLSEFDMIMCLPEEAQQFATRNIERSEISMLRPTPNHFGATYSDTLELNFFITKHDIICKPQSEARLTGVEINRLMAWLESPKKPKELYLRAPENDMDVYYYGIFSSIQPYVLDDICYGLTLVFTCDSPYGFSSEKIRNININYAGTISTKILNESANLEDYIYPIIKIYSQSTFPQNTTLTIINESDNNHGIKLTLPYNNEGLIVNSKKKLFYRVLDGSEYIVGLSSIGIDINDSSMTNSSTAPSTDYSNTNTHFIYFPRLIPGYNTLRFILSSSNISNIEICYRNIIKSGGF